MSLILFGKSEQELIQRVKKYAEENPFTLEMLAEFALGQFDPERLKGYQCVIPVGLHLQYTIEDHPQTNGKVWKFRHLNLTLNHKVKLPTPEICIMMVREFGFTRSMGGCIVHLQEEGHVNILEPLD